MLWKHCNFSFAFLAVPWLSQRCVDTMAQQTKTVIRHTLADIKDLISME